MDRLVIIFIACDIRRVLVRGIVICAVFPQEFNDLSLHSLIANQIYFLKKILALQNADIALHNADIALQNADIAINNQVFYIFPAGVCFIFSYFFTLFFGSLSLIFVPDRQCWR